MNLLLGLGRVREIILKAVESVTEEESTELIIWTMLLNALWDC